MTASSTAIWRSGSRGRFGPSVSRSSDRAHDPPRLDRRVRTPRVKKNSASFLSAWYGTVGIEFNSPSHGVYASLLVVRDADAAAEDESGSPIGGNTTAAGGNAAIVRALAH